MVPIWIRMPTNHHIFRNFAFDQEFLPAGSRITDVHRREDALVGDLAIKNDLGVAGALELLEDHFVHAAAGVDQRRRDDRERTAFLDLPGRTEEAVWPLERIGIATTGQHFA